jgi:hypothetical protein
LTDPYDERTDMPLGKRRKRRIDFGCTAGVYCTPEVAGYADVCDGSFADGLRSMAVIPLYVRFTPNNGHPVDGLGCPLSAISFHRGFKTNC